MTIRPRVLGVCAILLVTLLVTVVIAQRSGSGVRSAAIFEAIGVREGLTVCEIGAGDGELTIEAARLVGPAGRVYSSELGEKRVETLRRNAADSGLTQITIVPGDPSATNFADATCDAVFMRNVYHHFADPAVMNASIAAALKPGGRLAIVDFTPRGEEAAAPGDRGRNGTHGVTPETVARETSAAGLEPISSERGDRGWFMVVAAKPGAGGC